MKKSIIIVAIFLSACNSSPTPDLVSVQDTALAKAWLAYTQTVAAIPTSAFTFTPSFTETPSPTSTITTTPLPTADPLFEIKGNGFYLVNVDIAPGIWRSTGDGDGCYWSITTKTGDIIDNHFGMSGGTAYIPVDGFQVEFKRCGNWEYLSGP